VGVPRRQLVALAAAGGFSTVTAAGEDRRSAIWAASGMGATGDLFLGQPTAEAKPALSPLSAVEELTLDARYAQTFPGRHPLELIRPALQRRGVLRARDLATTKPGTTVLVAGLVITRQRPQTASGVVFMTLEDETGNADLMVLPDRFLEFQTAARLAPALLVRGQLRADGLARSVTVDWMGPLTGASTSISSHDFH
jgi:error-prone DNA polymerase